MRRLGFLFWKESRESLWLVCAGALVFGLPTLAGALTSEPNAMLASSSVLLFGAVFAAIVAVAPFRPALIRIGCSIGAWWIALSTRFANT